MPIGSTVRKMFGAHEHKVAELYREMFMSLDDYAAQLQRLVPTATRILEVGCGEGAVTELLARIYPEADILAIDISPNAGRLYRGRSDRVTFAEATIQEIASQRAGEFDLVTLSDVLHHIPRALRPDILQAVERCVAPGGRFLLKDWERQATPIHALCYAGDRYLTGDRIAYLTRGEALDLTSRTFCALKFVEHGRIGPWSNNYTQLYAC